MFSFGLILQLQMKIDIQYSKLGIQVSSRVAERLKTQDFRKLGNVRKISKLGEHIVQCLASLQELRLCEQQLKNTQKQIPNFSFPAQFYWITPFCSKYFVRDCSLLQSRQGYQVFYTNKNGFTKFFEQTHVRHTLILQKQAHQFTFFKAWAYIRCRFGGWDYIRGQQDY